MRRKEKDLLCAYIYNNRNRLESEVRQLQSNIRHRSIDEIDCLELLIATVRLETFKETTKHIRLLLNLNKHGDEEKETAGE